MNLLMQLIEDKTQSFNTDDVLMLSLAFIKWCIDANMIQQGYTALEEALKTFVIVNYKDIIKKAVPDAQDKKCYSTRTFDLKLRIKYSPYLLKMRIIGK